MYSFWIYANFYKSIENDLFSMPNIPKGKLVIDLFVLLLILLDLLYMSILLHLALLGEGGETLKSKYLSVKKMTFVIFGYTL